ncbi:ABC transporter permease [Nonomuraea sp. KC401]|uniref:ABC transporter permease n=1 Tax=Nonomuraea mesophila TaxID=2530382 RepID=A0A4R5FMV1_9ACTN|nr:MULTISPECIES: ABC transporter permease [Nonomuraea]NBE92648.1 ABC transporter permease subunit [Nonomuraea sp. K271]TDE54023.1 ABC transporter permease [Nonomuraea mesophila]TLF84599.1 ABC transporter permease [Nonomuraea sp. KC401]
MLTYTLRRLLISIPVIVASTFVVFLLVTMAGDPLAGLKGRNPPPSPQVIAVEEQRLHLDEPPLQRYWTWITGVAQGDFGPSVRTNVDIGHEIAARFGVTLRLVAVAVLLALVLAVVVGVISAVKQYSGIDYGFTFAAFLFLSMPSFWFAVLLKQGGISLNNLLGDQVVYTIGDRSVIVEGGAWAQLADTAGHMVLPTISLALLSFGAWSRFQRASMLDVLNSDYVLFARAKGLSRRRVIVRHALRTALIPMTTVTALDFATLISGAVITETVFQWRGLGEFLVTSVNQRDAYAVLAWLLVIAVAVIVFNLIADLLYALLDPRIRHE